MAQPMTACCRSFHGRTVALKLQEFGWRGTQEELSGWGILLSAALTLRPAHSMSTLSVRIGASLPQYPSDG